MFLKELADKTRRGLRGRVQLGKAGGGLCLGIASSARSRMASCRPASATRRCRKKWKTAEPDKRFRQFVRPTYLCTGMTRCGVCGAGFVVYYRDRLGCFGTRERDTCTNKLTIPRHEVEARVLTAL